jgi:hypothetical protein
MNTESDKKHEEAETRNEGETAIHEHGDPGPGGGDLGDAVLAATRGSPLPPLAVDRLIREARGGNNTALYAVANSAKDVDVEFPDDLTGRLEKLANDGDHFAMYLVGHSDVTTGHAFGDESLIKKGLKLLRAPAGAGMGDATWSMAMHEALDRRPVAALELARTSVSQGYRPAGQVVGFNMALNGLLRMHAQAAKESAPPLDPRAQGRPARRRAGGQDPLLGAPGSHPEGREGCRDCPRRRRRGHGRRPAGARRQGQGSPAFRRGAPRDELDAPDGDRAGRQGSPWRAGLDCREAQAPPPHRSPGVPAA